MSCFRTVRPLAVAQGATQYWLLGLRQSSFIYYKCACLPCFCRELIRFWGLFYHAGIKELREGMGAYSRRD